MLVAHGPLTDSEVSRYQETVLVGVKQMFDQEEISFLCRAAKIDRQFDAHAVGRRDGERGKARLSLDCNLLFRSDHKLSESPRWSVICCYDAACNGPYKERQNPRYSALHLVLNSAIREVGMRRFPDSEAPEAWFMDPENKSTRNLKRRD